MQILLKHNTWSPYLLTLSVCTVFIQILLLPYVVLSICKKNTLRTQSCDECVFNVIHIQNKGVQLDLCICAPKVRVRFKHLLLFRSLPGTSPTLLMLFNFRVGLHMDYINPPNNEKISTLVVWNPKQAKPQTKLFSSPAQISDHNPIVTQAMFRTSRN